MYHDHGLLVIAKAITKCSPWFANSTSVFEKNARRCKIRFGPMQAGRKVFKEGEIQIRCASLLSGADKVRAIDGPLQSAQLSCQGLFPATEILL